MEERPRVECKSILDGKKTTADSIRKTTHLHQPSSTDLHVAAVITQRTRWILLPSLASSPTP